MTYSLHRKRDGAGDSGPMSEAIKPNHYENTTDKLEVVGTTPEIGARMRVGSYIARSFSQQDWWLTTPITKIVKEVKTENEHIVVFETESGSTYTWKEF